MQSSHLHRFTLEQPSPSFKHSSNERISEQRVICAPKTLDSQQENERDWEEEAVGFGPLWGLYDMWI